MFYYSKVKIITVNSKLKKKKATKSLTARNKGHFHTYFVLSISIILQFSVALILKTIPYDDILIYFVVSYLFFVFAILTF